jgi:hypothetical protein
MVNMTPEEVMAMKNGQRDPFEEMSQMDRDIAGADTAKHLVIPMCDIYNLRRVAGLLHGLAADLDVLSRRHDVRARTLILETRALIDETNRRIRDMTGKGKRKKPWQRVEN